MGFDDRDSTGLGETEFPLLEGTCKVLCTPEPREKSSDLVRTESDLPASSGESLVEVKLGTAVAHCGDKDIGGGSSGEHSLP